MNLSKLSCSNFVQEKIVSLYKIVKDNTHFNQQIRYQNSRCDASPNPRHLICFKQWTAEMVMDIIHSAMKLKKCFPDTHGVRLEVLAGSKIMTLQEVNQPILNLSVSKAATMLGASYVNITDSLVWDHDYMGRVFSQMTDAIFVSTTTHMCVQRFSKHSLVPVLCMHSRTHASIQALATIMTIIEEWKTIIGLNIGYLGPPHPVLNSYLLLCPMLEANILFKCCCDKSPVSPLLFKASEEMSATKNTLMKACKSRQEVLKESCVIIAGPTTAKKEKIKEHFAIDLTDLTKSGDKNWIFIHTCPRGAEVKDDLFEHENARTYNVFENMQYIAAALMANAIKGYLFHLHM